MITVGHFYHVSSLSIYIILYAARCIEALSFGPGKSFGGQTAGHQALRNFVMSFIDANTEDMAIWILPERFVVVICCYCCCCCCCGGGGGGRGGGVQVLGKLGVV